MKSKLLSYLILFINLYLIYSHRCGADSIKIKPYIINKDKVNNNNKRRLSDDFTPIKIKVDFTKLEHQVGDSTLNFYKEVFTEVSHIFSSLLLVQHYNIDLNIDIINNSCYVDEVGNGVESWLYNNDVVIFPYVDNTYNDDIIASAAACLILDNYKPVGGIVALNRHFSKNKEDSKEYMEMVLLHELSHVLGFHPGFFEALNLMGTETRNGIKYSFINSPKVLEKAKIHFNCENIKVIQLEDQGGDGSAGAHWEARYMLGDYMISTDYTENVISDITLALFEDTGFYKVNYYTGGLFRFGKNQGCAFLEELCIKNENYLKTSFPNEFCVESTKSFCGSSHISRGICYIVRYDHALEEKYQYFSENNIGGVFSSANYCPISYLSRSEQNILSSNYYYPSHCNYGYPILESKGEKIGSNSLCFESSLNLTDEESICYEVECDKFEKKIIIKIGTLKVICPGNRTLITNPDGFIGNITCPEYNLVCSSEVPCNDMLDCIRKKSTVARSTYLYIKSNKLTINYFCLFFVIIFYLL